MSQYILLYGGPATPPDQMTKEAVEKEMKLWEVWMKNLGPAMADMGKPFGPGGVVADDGSSKNPADFSGYSIVEADTLDAAKAMAKDHPFLRDASGKFRIEVFELMPM